jgi:alanyl-tRNA synthetase
VTERLYYTDAYAAGFDAEVVAMREHDGRPAAVLDRTAFYPTSGGQPYDTGRLGDATVLDVIDDAEDGTVVHVVDRPLPAGPIHGTIDWTRRFEHMQQHTGQHVLSAAFARLFDARTESFHLGSVSSTIDLARPMAPAEIARAEDEANRVVWEDRPVHIRFMDADEAAKLPLRKEPARGGRLRLIDIEDFDLSACGGTHVSRTGGIGIIAVASWEKFRGGTRVEFLCGVRALAGYRVLRDAAAASIRLISVSPPELPAGIERLQAELRESKRTLKDAQARLAIVEAAALAAGAERHGPVHLVVRALHGWDAGGLKAIASAIVERPAHAAVLFGDPPASPVVIMRSRDAAVDCAALLAQVTSRFGGKGGGKPDAAQGGGVRGSSEELVEFVRTLVGA